MVIALIVILVLVLILLFWGIGSYNSIVKLKNKTEEAESDAEVYMKKRFDLVPNLVETVKGYAKHESTTFENVTKARTMGLNASSLESMDEANSALSGALKSLFAVAESYPELKANQNFLTLQSELTNIENEIAKARKYYNGTARLYNNKILVFPSSIIAKMFHFTKLTYIKIEEESKQAPKVRF